MFSLHLQKLTGTIQHSCKSFEMHATWLRSEKMALGVRLCILFLSIYDQCADVPCLWPAFSEQPSRADEQFIAWTTFLSCTDLKRICFKLGIRHRNVILRVECLRYFSVIVQLKVFNPKFNYCCFFYKNSVSSITVFPQIPSMYPLYVSTVWLQTLYIPLHIAVFVSQCTLCRSCTRVSQKAEPREQCERYSVVILCIRYW